YSIARDGTWTAESVFQRKLTLKNKGKLSAKDLEKLAGNLDKYQLGKLPEKTGIQPGANPHTITLEFGTKKANWVGQMPPKVDRDNPVGTVDSRFAGILEAVTSITSDSGVKQKP